MKVKQTPLIFQHVMSATTVCGLKEWYAYAQEFRNAIIRNGLYGTGPIMYQVEPVEEDEEQARFTFYLPVNQAVELEGNDKFHFYPQWQFDDGLLIRHADLDVSMEESYAALLVCAETYGFTLQQPYLHIYLDVYGEGMIDIYAPIAKDE